MSIKFKLKDGMKDAMRAKDKIRLDTIRLALSEIQYEEIQKKVGDLTDADITSVIQREIKKRKESIEIQEKAGRAEEAEKSRAEISVLESYLPKQLTESELRTVIEGYKASNPSLNVGLVMKLLKEQHAGSFDSKLASDVARTICG